MWKDRQCLKQAVEERAIEANRALWQIWMAETKKDALAAFDAFVESWGVKYNKAVEC
jgi:putative transposase